MEKPNKYNLNFLDNFNYLLANLNNATNEANYLEDKIYFELSKKQIIEYLDYVNKIITPWEAHYKNNNYKPIIDKYKEIESIISELELCLAEHDNLFHMNGISYSLFQIGKILYNEKKESDKDGR